MKIQLDDGISAYDPLEDIGDVLEDIGDLLVREERRHGRAIDVWKYAAYSDGKKVTTVLLFNGEGKFMGGGTSIKTHGDKFNQEHGFRLAASKALRSVTAHEINYAKGYDTKKRVHVNA
jgi:hypothetical protein